ncbi:MAG: DUF2332 domain-containing protein [Rhizomicrobium sp.]
MSAKVADYWTFFADDAKRTGSLLYSRLSEGIGKDEGLKALCAHARAGQPHANMILGAVHFLLLRGADHPLKRFYATIGGTASPQNEDPFPDFLDFVRAHRATIQRLIETQVTNTNEIGPSAGLNMIWDTYGVRYRQDGKIAASINEGAPLVIESELRGERLPPTGPLPNIGGRVGLELNPVDLSNADDRDWLRALIWPDQGARLRRMDRAIELFMQHNPVIRTGDALELLPDALADVPRGQTACVYHTIAIYQFSREMKQGLENILTVAGLRQPVWRLSFEYDGARYILSAIRYSDGVRQEKRLASSHPHGTWLEWLA